MATINRLVLDNIRNLSHAELKFSSRYNLCYGSNGSGKTSILESIYLLSNGKSFRSHNKSRIIQHQQDSFTIFAEVISHDSEEKIGMQKSQNGHTRLQLNGEKCKSLAMIAEILPVVLIDPNSYGLIEDGPTSRRQYLDWGLFHVEQSYAQLTSDYAQCLKQRNAALKQSKPIPELKLWDGSLASLGEQIHCCRLRFLEAIEPFFHKLIIALDFSVDVQLDYAPGWDQKLDLLTAIQRGLGKDMALGYTTVGPQRADVLFSVNDVPASDVLSRGQEKLVVTALMLAQGEYYRHVKQDECIYLIDDLPSELDQSNRDKLFELLATIPGQMLITATDVRYFPKNINMLGNVFHVKHGILQVV
jgi:DNA replication and repair protein RecF